MALVSDYEGYALEDLHVGMTADYEKTVTTEDILAFANVSGDRNPIHVDPAYAEQTMFKGQIAHGMLSAAFFSTILGMKLPGPGCIYLGQNLRFRAPVRPGDHVTARATVTKIEKNRVYLDCAASVGETVVVDGEAIVLVPSRADTD